MPENSRRLAIIAVFAAVLVIGGLIDRTGSAAAPRASAALAPVPVAAPAAALSSSWFCAGATDSSKGNAPGAIVIANLNADAVTGSIDLVGSGGTSTRRTVTVGPRARQVVKESVPGGTPWIGAVVDLDSGGVAVDQEIDSTLGQSDTPCATTGSNEWFFATGATRINQDMELSLLNPYPTDSVVDLTFSTDQGVEQPGDFQGVDVPANGMTVVDLRSHLRRRQAIATTVRTRTGRVVAWQTDVVTPPASGAAIVGTPAAASPNADPAAAIAGVTDTLGAPSAGTSWVWPDGIAGDGVDERYVIYNPGSAVAHVQLSVQLAAGRAQPFELTVGPQQVTTVDSGGEARIPAGVAHSAVLTSTNGVPVVAERALSAGSPSNRTGLGELLGGRYAANGWLLPPGTTGPTQDEYVVIYNPGTHTASVTIAGLAAGQQTPLPGVGHLTVGAGQRLAVRVNDHLPAFAGALVVQAGQPVEVEQDLYGAGRTPGVSLSFGVPLT